MKTVRFEPHIVALGGGTGLSTLLRGLKKYTSQITAVVTVTDDGGSSGTLRRELGVLPPGDIRNCLVALSEEENLMTRLFQYRFPSAGSLSGHSFGNLFLTAMSSLTGGFDSGIAEAGNVLAISGRVLPVTLSSVALQAMLADGTVLRGESTISRSTLPIRFLSLYPSSPPADPRVIEAIQSADLIVIGPGSLYSSVIANLLVGGITRALRNAKAPIVYICNIMTQPGETTGYTLNDHLAAIERHAGGGLIDYLVVNKGAIPLKLLRRYARRGSYPVTAGKSDGRDIKVLRANLVSPVEYARHDSDKLARAILSVLRRAGIRKA